MPIEYKEKGEIAPEILAINESYLEHRYMWTLSKDFIKGDATVKRKNELYLPMPAGFVLNSDNAIGIVGTNSTQNNDFDKKYDFITTSLYDDPNYHQNKSYSLYKHGAKTPAILKHTVNGLLGLIVKKPMEFLNNDSEKKELPDDFNKELWLEKIRKMITLSLSFGRLFVTLDQNNIPVIYNALDATNWKQDLYVNLIEFKENSDQNLDTDSQIEFIRISQLDSKTIYERFDSDAKLLDRKSTTKFKNIPVICIGSTDLDWDVDILPLEGIATCALHIYKKSADLSYSEFSSCVPTMVMTGVDDDDSGNKIVGGGVALVIANYEAKVYYATTDSNALQHVKIHIDALFEEAKTYGASLLGGDKNEVESADAIKLRQGAAGASLTTLTRNIELAINKLLKIANIDIHFKINFDLEENYMSPQEQDSLLNSWMNQGISYSSYFDKMKKAGNINDDRTIEEELKEIKEEQERKQALVKNNEIEQESNNDNNSI